MDPIICRCCLREFIPYQRKATLCSPACRAKMQTKIGVEQRCEVIAQRGKETAASISARTGIAEGSIRRVWYEARRRGEMAAVTKPTKLIKPPVPVRSVYTNMVLRVAGPVDLPDDSPLTDAGKVFMAIGEQECLWHLGRDADGDLRFCGAPRERWGDPGCRKMCSRYCAHHGLLALRDKSPRVIGRRRFDLIYPEARTGLKYSGPITDPINEFMAEAA